jgi:importin subunit beta-1
MQALVTLSAADHQTSTQAANFIASIAAIEIPRNDWPDLMQTLLEGVQSGSKSLKLGSYKAMEYICETVVWALNTYLTHRNQSICPPARI